MLVGAGLSSSFGIATETTFGVPVPVTRFYEYDSESMSMEKHTFQGMGLRQGGLTKRGARRGIAGREAHGDVNFDPTTNGFGLILSHMLGSVPAGGTLTPTQVGSTALYQQVHNVGTLNGRSFTAQIVDPDTTGVLGQQAFTYPGCKVGSWEFSVAAGAQAKLKLTLDAIDEATPSNGFAATTLAAAVTAGATSIQTAAAIPAGAYITVDYGAGGEVLQTLGAATGSGPYTSTLNPAFPAAKAHSAGAFVGNATNVNYGAATALQTASYNAGTNLFSFAYGGVYVGGTTTVTNGVWGNSGGQRVGSVRNFSITGTNAMKTDRWQLGYVTKSEQIENGFRDYKASVEIDYTSRFYYDAYAADVPVAISLQFTTPSGAALSFYAPYAQQNDGASPEVSGPDVISQKLAFEFLDDGVNGALQAVYTSTDQTI